MSLHLPFVVTPLKVLVTLFVLFAWSRAVHRYQDKTFNWKELLFWTLLWGAALIVVYTPERTQGIAHFLGVGRGADALFTAAIILMFYMIYRLYSKIDRMERDLTELVRRLSLQERRRR